MKKQLPKRFHNVGLKIDKEYIKFDNKIVKFQNDSW